jgi:putative addiction module component (TIGR02574 family)
MRFREILNEAISLPVEQRVVLADALLGGLKPTDADNDLAWIAEAGRRLDEVRSGKVAAIPADEVFAEIRERFAE